MALGNLAKLILAATLFAAFIGSVNAMPLSPCPNKPNCVCSEHQDDAKHAIAPIQYRGDVPLEAMLKAIGATGGLVVEKSDTAVHATYTSRLFRFVDDVHMRWDADKGLIQVRSASRVGYSDFGVNRKRVEALRKLLQAE